jgi:hypothetical protein
LRNAALSEVPVSTSVRMSLRSLVTLALGLPAPTMSKAAAAARLPSSCGELAREDGDVLRLDPWPERIRPFLILVR